MTPLALRLSALFVAVAIASAGCGGDDSAGEQSSAPAGTGEVLPTGGEAPAQRITDLGRAAKSAGCLLRSTKTRSRDHTVDPAEPVRYATNPPSSGRHFQVAAEDGAYSAAPEDTAVVHAFEHGRVGVWFSPTLPEDSRAALRAFFEEDGQQMLVVPRRGMPYAVAASAWNRDPQPFGTGQLLLCPRLNDAGFDALRAFRDEHRGRGPEPIP